MKKVVRIGKVADQDDFRRDDIRNMSPNDRVNMVIKMQREFFNWETNSKIKRVAKVRKLNHT